MPDGDTQTVKAKVRIYICVQRDWFRPVTKIKPSLPVKATNCLYKETREPSSLYM